MKLISSGLLIAAMFIFGSSFAQTTKETIPVWGNCGMCKSKIEKAAMDAGASKAKWSEKSKQLKVTYDASNTSSAKIQEAIANVGYDTKDFTAPESAYNSLHHCCQYERKGAAKASSACCNMEGCAKDHDACKAKGCCKGMNCCKS